MRGPGTSPNISRRDVTGAGRLSVHADVNVACRNNFFLWGRRALWGPPLVQSGGVGVICPLEQPSLAMKVPPLDILALDFVFYNTG